MILKRPLTEDELELAFKKLENQVKIIRENNAEYFLDVNNPKSIDYMQVSGQIDWSGLTVYNVPFISFIDQSLSEEIKKMVRQSFIDIVKDIVN